MIKFHLKNNISSRGLKNRVVYIVVLFVIIATVSLWNPDESILPDCQFHSLTGYDCPSCGLTRSFYSFSHFHASESFRFHPMGPILFVALLVLFLKYSYEIAVKREIQIKVNPVLIKISVILFFSIWIGLWIMRLVK